MENQGMDDQHHVVKLTITYKDGHTEEHDTFMCVVADGMTPVGVADDGLPIYMDDGESLQTRAMAHVSASPEIMASLINTILHTISETLGELPKEAALQLLMGLKDIRTRSSGGHSSINTKEIHPRDN